MVASKVIVFSLCKVLSYSCTVQTVETSTVVPGSKAAKAPASKVPGSKASKAPASAAATSTAKSRGPSARGGNSTQSGEAPKKRKKTRRETYSTYIYKGRSSVSLSGYPTEL